MCTIYCSTPVIDCLGDGSCMILPHFLSGNHKFLWPSHLLQKLTQASNWCLEPERSGKGGCHSMLLWNPYCVRFWKPPKNKKSEGKPICPTCSSLPVSAPQSPQRALWSVAGHEKHHISPYMAIWVDDVLNSPHHWYVDGPSSKPKLSMPVTFSCKSFKQMWVSKQEAHFNTSPEHETILWSLFLQQFFSSEKKTRISTLKILKSTNKTYLQPLPKKTTLTLWATTIPPGKRFSSWAQGGAPATGPLGPAKPGLLFHFFFFLSLLP